MARQPLGGLGRLIFRGFTITFIHTTLGMTPLDEGSARRRDLYLTTHNTHKKQTSMPPVGFEPAIPASERPQTHALDRAATGIDNATFYHTKKIFMANVTDAEQHCLALYAASVLDGNGHISRRQIFRNTYFRAVLGILKFVAALVTPSPHCILHSDVSISPSSCLLHVPSSCQRCLQTVTAYNVIYERFGLMNSSFVPVDC
jgi:hypothetical protein